MALSTTQKGQITKTSGPCYGWVNRFGACSTSWICAAVSGQARVALLFLCASSKGDLLGERVLAAQKGGLELGSPLPCKMLGYGPSTVEQRKQAHRDSPARLAKKWPTVGSETDCSR